MTALSDPIYNMYIYTLCQRHPEVLIGLFGGAGNRFPQYLVKIPNPSFVIDPFHRSSSAVGMWITTLFEFVTRTITVYITISYRHRSKREFGSSTRGQPKDLIEFSTLVTNSMQSRPTHKAISQLEPYLSSI